MQPIVDQNQVLETVRSNLEGEPRQNFIAVNFNTAIAPEIRNAVAQEFQKQGQCEWPTTSCFTIRR